MSDELAPVGRNEDWIVLTPLIDEATGLEVDLSNANLRLSLQRGEHVALAGSIEDETISLIEPNLMQWNFDHEKWRQLAPGEYDVFLDVAIDGDTSRVFAGILPIIENGPAA